MLVVFSPLNLRRSSEEAFKLARGYAVEQMRIVQCRAQRSACGMTSVRGPAAVSLPRGKVRFKRFGDQVTEVGRRIQVWKARVKGIQNVK